MRLFTTLLLLSPLLNAQPLSPRLQNISPSPSLDGEPVIQDFGADGLQDLFFPTKSGSYRTFGLLLRNQGNRAFAKPVATHYPESQPDAFDSDAISIELNGAGDDHLFFNQIQLAGPASTHTPVLVALDKPDTFGERIPIGVPSGTPWFPIDLDGDHRSEFIQANPDGSGLILWDRQPNGSYSPQSFAISGGIYMDLASVADIDHDGDLDLILNWDDDRLIIERTGNRSFAATKVTVSLDFESKLADLDGDGLPDFYSTGEQTFSWRRNLGNFSFASPQIHTLPPAPSYGSRVVKVQPQANAGAILHSVWYENNVVHVIATRFGSWELLSNRTVDPGGLKGIQDGPAIRALEDFDLDGQLDLLMSVPVRFSAGEYNLYLNRAAIAWGTTVDFGIPLYIDPTPVSDATTLVQDFDRNGSTDLILGPDFDGNFVFLANSGAGTFPTQVRLTEIAPPAGTPAGTRISAIHAADLDGDSILDLAVDYVRPYNYDYQKACGIAKGRGDGTFMAPVLPAGSFNYLSDCPCGIDQLFDWDGDGDLDAIGKGAWRENLGGHFSTETRTLIGGAGATDLLGNPITLLETRVGDVDGDGFPDIVSLVYRTVAPPFGGIVGGLNNIGSSYFAVGFNDGHGGIASIAEVPVTLASMDLLGNPVVSNLAIADLNADGKPDIAVNEYSGTDLLGNPVTTNRWLRNPGGAAARNPASWLILPLGGGAFPSSPFLDFDGDGQREWVSPGGYLRPSPSGPLSSAGYNFMGGTFLYTNNEATHAADFDGDGDADFLLADSSGNLTLVRNLLIDERSAILRYLVASGVAGKNAAATKDADGDGRSNEIELMFGTDPLNPDQAPANPLNVQLHAAGNSPALSFKTPKYNVELNFKYQIERSTNLIDWTPANEDQSPSVTSDGSWNYTTLPIDNSERAVYFRIKASQAAN